MKPSSAEGFILYKGIANESGLNYLTHNPLVPDSSKLRAGYSDSPCSPPNSHDARSTKVSRASLATSNLFLEFGKVSYRN